MREELREAARVYLLRHLKNAGEHCLTTDDAKRFADHLIDKVEEINGRQGTGEADHG